MTAAAPPGRGWLAEFVLLAALWGASFLFMRIGTLQFGAWPTAAVRVTVAALFLLPLLAWRRQLGALRPHWKALAVVGLLNSGIPFLCYGFALQSIGTGLSSILNATVPLFGALVAWLWLGDRPQPSRVLGLVIGFVGVALLAWHKTGLQSGAPAAPALWAVAACLLATLSYGIAASFTRRHLDGVPPLVTATGSLLGAALMLALPAWWAWPASAPDTTAWLALLAVGVLCTGLAYLLFFRLIDSAGPARALTVTYVIPVFALAYGVGLLGESLSAPMVWCGAVIVFGTALASGAFRRPSDVVNPAQQTKEHKEKAPSK